MISGTSTAASTNTPGRSPAYHAYRRIRSAVGHLRRTLPGVFAMLPRVALISFQRLLGRSDYRRWSNAENLEKWWDSRTQKIAGFIPPESRVVEFGAGRRQLRKYLAPGCAYVASDLTPRTPDTVVCDLNDRPLPDLRHLRADVAIFSGVLEYVRDLPAVASWLSQQTAAIVASYDYVKSAPGSIPRIAELFERRHFGYLSNCTVGEFEAIFASAGFRCVQRDVWQSQQIMVFVSAGSPWAETALPTRSQTT